MRNFVRRTAMLAGPAALVMSAMLIPASAASAAPRPGSSTRVPAASCSSDEKQGGVDELSVEIPRAVTDAPHPTVVDTYIELWYSPTCRYVWAVEGGGGFSSDHIWVYNEDTGATENAYYPTIATAAIDDAGTQSHACIENDGALETLNKTCTGYF
jgi:hypothetical protein